MQLQTALRFIYPAQCLSCDALVEDDNGLCGACWRDTSFITGLACDKCGVPLPGEGDTPEICDSCMTRDPPWSRGRGAILYKGQGRRLVMGLKHGDRTELARPAAKWMAPRVPQLDPDVLLVPVPLHWLRYLKRRYNQSALLAQHLAKEISRPVALDALRRVRVTEVLNGKTHDARYATLDGSIIPHPTHGDCLRGRSVLLIDDVMTSGATMTACTEACFVAGARKVDILVLARAAKDI